MKDIDEISDGVRSVLKRAEEQTYRAHRENGELEDEVLHELFWLGYDLLHRKERLKRIRDGLGLSKVCHRLLSAGPDTPFQVTSGYRYP